MELIITGKVLDGVYLNYGTSGNSTINDKQTGVHYTNFTEKSLWLIINLQIEGSAGSADGTSYFAKYVTIKRKAAQ